MKKLHKGWLWAIATLLVMNLALTGFLFLEKNKRQKPGLLLSEKLGLNEEQKKQFETSKDAHFKTMKKLDEQMRNARASLFAETGSSNKLRTERLLSKIGELQEAKDRSVFEHFVEIRGFLKGDQVKEFEDFLSNMVSDKERRGPQGGMGGPQNGRPPRPGGEGPNGDRPPMEGSNSEFPTDRPPRGDRQGPPPNQDGQSPPPPRN